MPYSTTYKINPTNKDWKSIALLLCFFYFTSSCEAQLNTIIREVLETGARTAPKTILKTEARVLSKAIIESTAINEAISPILTSFERSPLLSATYKENALKFYNRLQEKNKEIIEIVEAQLTDNFRQQIIEDIADAMDGDNYLDEILENPLYPKLKQSICKIFNRESVTQKEIRLILHGIAIDSTCINKETLYAIYFKMSDSFAENELASIAKASNCEESAIKDVKAIAYERHVPFSATACIPENDDDIIYNIIVYILLSILLYSFIRMMIRKFRKTNTESPTIKS